jgi:hypothetical protein
MEPPSVRIAGLVGHASDRESELHGTPGALQHFAAWLRSTISNATVELDVADRDSEYPDALNRIERRFTDERQLRIGRRGHVLTVEGGSDAAEHLAASAEGVAIESLEVGHAPINRHQHIEPLGDEEDDWWPVALDSAPLVIVAAWPGIAVGSAT